VSEENVEIVQRLIEAWDRGDYSAALESIDPDIEVNVAYQADIDGTYRAHAGLAEMLGVFWAEFEGPRIEIEEAMPAGSYVVVGVRFSGRGKRSGVEVDAPAWHVWRLRGGKAVRWQLSGRSKTHSMPQGCRNSFNCPASPDERASGDRGVGARVGRRASVSRPSWPDPSKRPRARPGQERRSWRPARSLAREGGRRVMSPVVAPSSGISSGGCCGTRGTGSTGKGTRMQAERPQGVPFRTQHPLGVVVNRPSLWPDR
jgi:ketosteroid isomerase-like protein